MKDTLIIQPNTEAQLEALKAFLTALKIDFSFAKEEGKSPYNSEFVAKIRRSEQSIKDGKGRVMTVDQLNELWK